MNNVNFLFSLFLLKLSNYHYTFAEKHKNVKSIHVQTMKKFLALLTAIMVPCLFASAAPRRIILNGGESSPGRDGLPIYQDMPEAYYDNDDKTQWIIIDGGGTVSYYDVEISTPVTDTVEISTQVDGTYDTFDISSLPAGSHVITIESPSGNIYEGTF